MAIFRRIIPIHRLYAADGVRHVVLEEEVGASDEHLAELLLTVAALEGILGTEQFGKLMTSYIVCQSTEVTKTQNVWKFTHVVHNNK